MKNLSPLGATLDETLSVIMYVNSGPLQQTCELEVQQVLGWESAPSLRGTHRPDLAEHVLILDKLWSKFLTKSDEFY